MAVTRRIGTMRTARPSQCLRVGEMPGVQRGRRKPREEGQDRASTQTTARARPEVRGNGSEKDMVTFAEGLTSAGGAALTAAGMAEEDEGGAAWCGQM